MWARWAAAPVRRAIARLGARQISTRKAPVVLAADMARGFFGHMIAAVRGSSQYRKSSFLLDAAGEQVLPAFVQMQERPASAGCRGQQSLRFGGSDHA